MKASTASNTWFSELSLTTGNIFSFSCSLECSEASAAFQIFFIQWSLGKSPLTISTNKFMIPSTRSEKAWSRCHIKDIALQREKNYGIRVLFWFVSNKSSSLFHCVLFHFHNFANLYDLIIFSLKIFFWNLGVLAYFISILVLWISWSSIGSESILLFLFSQRLGTIVSSSFISSSKPNWSSSSSSSLAQITSWAATPPINLSLAFQFLLF